MQKLLIGTAAIALSGCSWIGNSHYQGPAANDGYGNYGQDTYSDDECCKTLSRWNLEGAVGAEWMVGGDFTTPEDITAIVGQTPHEVSMSDAYKRGMRYEVGGSYALNPNRKITLSGSYSKAEGKDVAFSTTAGAPDNVLRGTASDYKSYGLELGLRQYFQPSPFPVVRSIRPYIEGKIGAAKVDDISIENARDNGGAVNGGTIAMYESGWVPMAAGMIGVEAPIFKRATLGLETGLRYRMGLGGDNTDLSAIGALPQLEGMNNGSQNWSVPVMLRGRYRF